MQTRVIIAAISAVILLSAGAGLGVGWLWWGGGAGATEYADSDADERLGDVRADAVGDTDDAGDDFGDAVDAASRSGDRIADVTELLAGEYRDLGSVSDDVADGIRGDRELAGQMAELIGEGAISLDDRARGDNFTEGSSEDPEEHRGEAGGDAGAQQPP